METGASSDKNGYEVIKNGSWFIQFRNGYNPWMARYVYGLMFLLVNLLAWVVRDYGRGALTEMKKFKNCKDGLNCLGTEGVLRLLLTCNMAFVFVLFFFSGEIAHFGAGVFLLIQLISIISFITWLNEFFLSQKDAERCHVHVMLLATIAYTLCILGVILMYIWYVPDPSCLLNIFFITWTLFLIQLMASISLHPKINAGFLTPSLMGLYVVFICCEPVGEICNRNAESSSRTDWLTIISFVVALLAMRVALQFRKDENQEEDAIPYGYGFFHFVFATGAMYFAMLLIGGLLTLGGQVLGLDVGGSNDTEEQTNNIRATCHLSVL
ncbi:hypothetical protein YC2023_094182 [Brassica napus]